MTSIQEFFHADSSAEAIFWLIASVSTVLFVLKIIIGVLGAELEWGSEVEGDFFTLDTVLSGAVVFGWTGVLAYAQTDLHLAYIFGCAFMTGTATLFCAFFIYKNIRSLEASGNLNLENAVGKIGKVYLTVPADENEKGQVEVLVQGRLSIFEASTQSSEPISTGEEVLIYDATDDCLLVEKYTEETLS
ncbi:MAG: hypothetical protein MI784_02605 [Cytophagales bacterium]|nr:hypothetical protein [Cytophagales bacterium]